MERKLATVLFADLVGSTEFVSAQDPEITRRRVTAWFEAVSGCIETHGGTVEKFAGDAVMAAFGIPQSHEDDAERAVRAALGILDHAHDVAIEARIGIEAGEVVVDELSVRVDDRERAVGLATEHVGGARGLVVQQLTEVHA